jgi:RecA-family ATPase
MDADIVDELGMLDPERVLPKLVPAPAYYTEWKDPRPPKAPMLPAPRPVPEWVVAARGWTPAASLDAMVRDVQFAVQGLIQEGLVGALVAAGGTGKTTLLLTLAVCIGTGRPFFGRQVRQGTFVLFSNDDSQEDLEAALALVCRAMRLSDDEALLVLRKVRIFSLQGFDGTKTFTVPDRGVPVAAGLDEFILQAVDDIGDLVGIGLDTLRQFSGGNSNDEQVIKLTVAAATIVAQRSGAFVLFPHHTGKQNYRDGVADMYAASGSAAIADNCRFVLVLQETTWSDIEGKVRRTGQEQGDPLVLTPARGSIRVKKAEPIFLHRDGYYLGQIAGASLTRDQQADDKDRAILLSVRHGATTKNAIAATVKGNRRAALERIDELEGRGFLARGSESGSAKWALTTKATAFLEATS